MRKVRKTFRKVVIFRGVFLMLWECNTIPVQNTLRTRVKQIKNPQKEISGGFFSDICNLK